MNYLWAIVNLYEYGKRDRLFVCFFLICFISFVLKIYFTRTNLKGNCFVLIFLISSNVVFFEVLKYCT